ncbi:MAG: AAA family ATPase [Candidatus Poribacteria bacterium]|nr:AAA family ATPase [Candidatus Poribacteria bacterium]MDD9974469.1 AAA family ATPase [Candidatus Poribacteria bacterium]
MSEQKAFLEKVHIKNYRSLRNVTLPLKSLTVLVGPNASGKSNTLNALRLFQGILSVETPPTKANFLRDRLWVGGGDHITCELHAKVKEKLAQYTLVFKTKDEDLSIDEELLVNSVKVISIQNGEGQVQDENSKNATKYTSNKLALRSAGDYGHKPVTSALTAFIQGWEFYDFEPNYMRTNSDRSSVKKETLDSQKLGSYGTGVPDILQDWYENSPEDFQYVSEALAAVTNINIDYCKIDGGSQLCLLEGYKKPIPLTNASDGTLRLLAYNTLLNQSKLPPLITIEEPERNLHPGALKDIAYILERLAERTQVIITTHSSQLLDTFSSKSLSDSLGVLLLRNRPKLGTEVLNIENIRDKREAFADWIADFGIGSAVFDSGLLQDLMEEPI